MTLPFLLIVVVESMSIFNNSNSSYGIFISPLNHYGMPFTDRQQPVCPYWKKNKKTFTHKPAPVFGLSLNSLSVMINIGLSVCPVAHWLTADIRPPTFCDFTLCSAGSRFIQFVFIFIVETVSRRKKSLLCIRCIETFTTKPWATALNKYVPLLLV